MLVEFFSLQHHALSRMREFSQRISAILSVAGRLSLVYRLAPCGQWNCEYVFQMCYTLAMRLREHVVVRIDAKSLKAIQRIAKQEDESVARIIRRAISAFLERHKGK